MKSEAEQKIQSCMAAEGFAYTPVPAATENVDAESGPGPQNPEWRKQFGFGIATMMLDPSFGMAASVAQGPVDPNEKLVAKLSAPEKRAYYIALDGSDPGDLDQPGSLAPPNTTGPGHNNPGGVNERDGCRGKAYSKLDSLFNLSAEALALQSELNEAVNQRLNENPSVRKASGAFIECLRNAGNQWLAVSSEPVSLQMKITQHISDKVRAIVLNEPVGSAGIGSSEQGGVAPFVPQGTTNLSPSQKSALRKLRTEEIRLAEVSAKCEKAAAFGETYSRQQFLAEKKVVNERSADIAALGLQLPT